jgi:2,3-bisphosphoglycerate-independent phosphoglycerate mutase
MSGPLVLVVIDGFGIAPAGPGNAVSLARTPNLDALAREGSASRLSASGLPVGLPDGQQGNSEVGHLNLGAGRRVPQMLVRIDEAIADGSFDRLPAVVQAMDTGRRTALHLIGLVGDGGVHASQRHLAALLDLARRSGVERVCVHALTDGRDTRPDSALGFVAALEAQGVTVATVCGRYWAMDRDKRWDRTKRAYDALVHGIGERTDRAADAIRASYDRGVSDEFIEPFVVGDPASGRVREGDAVIYWNFRPDRARQLTEALGDPGFDGFDRDAPPTSHLMTMTRYRSEWDYPVAFEAQDVRQGLAEHVSAMGLRQLHVAETEKYAHVTYFFNGGREAAFDGEERVLVQSPQHVATYDHAPAMSADGIRAALLQQLAVPAPPAFVVVNFANADMVGHTGVIPAAVAGIEAVDACMGDIRAAVAAAGGLLAVTADHGNSEVMLEPDGSPNTAHTTNPVPFWVDRPGLRIADEGKLGDVAPTLCALVGWDPSPAMTGTALVE